MRLQKSIFMFLVIAWASLGTYAQMSNRIHIPDIRMSRGGEAVMSVNMDNVGDVTAVEFTMEVPTGFSINPVSAILTSRATDHQITARALKNGKYKFVIMSTTNASINGIAGKLFTVRVKSDDTVTDDMNYPMMVSNAVMSTKSGENILQAVEAGRMVIKSMPNLHVVSLDCSEPVAGNALTIKWKVRNDGRGSTGDAQWKDYIWLVPNISAGTSMTGTKLLATVENISALAPDESYENTVNVTLEERIYGNYDLLVTSNMYGANDIDFSKNGGNPPVPYLPETEAYGFLTAKSPSSYITVEEEGEYDGLSDNFFYKRINIAVPPLPDIQVPHVVAVVDNSESYAGESKIPSPINNAGLASSSAFYSGKKIKVTATIGNKGDADVENTKINNVLYISSTPTLGEGKAYKLSAASMQLSVKAGESAYAELSGTIPYEWYGDTYFIVDADVNDAVYELANTANNSGVSDKLNTLLTPGADFEPYKLSVPSLVSSGSSFDIAYSVRNIGPGIPFSNSWIDRIYISSKATWDESAKEIATYTQNGYFSSTGDGYEYKNDSYIVNRTVSIGTLASGTYYIHVAVDADNKVFEYDGEENNILTSEAISLVSPDLSVELISVSEDTLFTNEQVAITWKVKNTGAADVMNATATDQLFAGSDANGGNLISLGMVTNNISIAAGSEKILRTNITVPENASLNGLKYFFVKTNVTNTIKEANTANNLSSGLVRYFEYIAGASSENVENIKVKGTNLTVLALQAPSETVAGNTIPLSYSIKNTGDITIGKNIKQEVFISKNRSYNSSAKLCSMTGTLPDVANLKTGESVTANLQITIPDDMMGGQNYIHVVLNRDATFAEKRTDDNYAETPIYVNGNLPNWVMSDLAIPATIMTSEGTEVTWTLSNSGSWDASDVTNRVYLSTDANYSTDDKLLAHATSSELAKGASEKMKATIIIPDNVVGSRYIIVRLDANSLEEENKDDNVASRSFISKQSPLPDLTVSELSTEGQWKGGQSVTIKAKVKNNGDHATRIDKWADVFYLSEGYTLDVNKAIKLGSKTHVGLLEKGEEYMITASVNIPVDVSGYYVLFAAADGGNALVEKTKDNNKVYTTVYVEDRNDTPADLVVGKLAAPSTILAGETVTISYNIVNRGEYAATGKLRDVLYMSKDDVWDENDVMAGVVNGDVALEPGNELTRTVSGRITNMPEGDYYLIVRTNSARTIAESDYDNNSMVQYSATSVEFARLTLDGSVDLNTSGLFKLELHSGLEGKTIGLYLSHPEESSAGIYSAFETVPSTAKYEFVSSNLDTEQQEILIPDVKAGTYYILAQDNAAVARNLNEFVLDETKDTEGTSMTLTAQEVLFGATSLSIREGGSNGWISTDIRGALFDSIMDFRLVREHEVIPAEAITFHNQTLTKVTFNLNDVETGNFDVVSELPDGTFATMPEGFKVIPGQSVNLGIKLELPSASRSFSYAPISIAYANGGNTDIVIKELLIVATNAVLSTTVEGLKDNKSEIHVIPDYPKDRRGYVAIPPGTQEVINCYIGADNGCTITVYIVK